MQYDADMTGHYGPATSLDGLGASPVYDPVAGGHHGRASLPLQASALPRSPAYSPHPSVAVPSLPSPYSAAAAGGGGGVGGGYSSTPGAAINSTSSAAAAAAVDSLLKRDKDAIYRRAHRRSRALQILH